MNKEKNIKEIEKIFNSAIKTKYIHEAVLLVENERGSFSYNIGHGDKSIETPLFMASVAKLFTTSCILILLEEKKIFLDDKLTKYFDYELLRGLHIYKGREYSFELTIANLLFQTSGLPDAIEDGPNSVIAKAIKKDFYITFDEKVKLTKKATPHFAPGTKNKAYYADFNFDLLGYIIEKISGLTLAEAFDKYIFKPLNLTKTYLPINKTDEVPIIYFQDKKLHRPKLLMGMAPGGNAITTANELMIFLKAFFGGKLFDKNIFNKLNKYNKLQISMGPLYYGGGYMQIPLGGVMTAFQGSGELIGHCGSTSSFAFYYPKEKLYFVGNFNQLTKPGLAIRTALKLAIKIK